MSNMTRASNVHSFIQWPASEQLKQINQVRLIAVRYRCITKTTALEEKHVERVGNPRANVGTETKSDYQATHGFKSLLILKNPNVADSLALRGNVI